MMCLEFVMILIRKGAIGVFSMAMLTLQGAWSQLKICADQTACPRHARLSPEPPLLQRDGQAQGLIAPTETGPQKGTGRTTTDTLLPEIWFKAQLLPLAAYYRGRVEAPQEESFSSQSNVCEKMSHTPFDPPKRSFIFRGSGSARFSLTL